MLTSGDRISWLNEVADQIMDGGANPPSIDRLYYIVASKIVTAINDGHCTAAVAFGEKMRKDYRAGQRVIVQEMVQLLREQGFVGGDDTALRWLKDLDGEWKVAIEDRQIPICGQRERRLGNERYLLGDRDETGDQFRIGEAGLLEAGRSRPFDVEVFKPRGGTKPMSFRVHPLALAIPPMSERERQILRESIIRDGVKMPLEIFEGKVLDGRNRLYFASELKKPVHIKEFKGTEAEARRHVFSLNLARRHLNMAQLVLAAINLFGDEATKEAAEATRQGNIRGNQNRSPSGTNLVSDGETKKWHERVAEKAENAGIKINAIAVRRMKQVLDAPETKAKVERGEIKTPTEAEKKAREEKGLENNHRDRSGEYVRTRLGSVVDFMREIISGEIVGKQPGTRPKNDDLSSISDRFDRIQQLMPQARDALRERKIIK
jgi:hypothetical protein